MPNKRHNKQLSSHKKRQEKACSIFGDGMLNKACKALTSRKKDVDKKSGYGKSKKKKKNK